MRGSQSGAPLKQAPDAICPKEDSDSASSVERYRQNRRLTIWGLLGLASLWLWAISHAIARQVNADMTPVVIWACVCILVWVWLLIVVAQRLLWWWRVDRRNDMGTTPPNE